MKAGQRGAEIMWNPATLDSLVEDGSATSP
jgi:hypothetical protein